MSIGQEADAEDGGAALRRETADLGAERSGFAGEVYRVRGVTDRHHFAAARCGEIRFELLGQAVTEGVVHVQDCHVLIAAPGSDFGKGFGREVIRRVHHPEDVIAGDAACRAAGSRGDDHDAVFVGKLLRSKHLRGGQGADDDLGAGCLDNGLNGSGCAFGRPFGILAGNLKADVQACAFEFGVHLLDSQFDALAEICAERTQGAGERLRDAEHVGDDFALILGSYLSCDQRAHQQQKGYKEFLSHYL